MIGTNVAGIVGGTYSGVAKNVKLEAVKVLNSRGVGSVADTLAGIDYVVGRKRREPNTPMVLNMSLGGPAVAIENQMVNAAVDAGIVVVAAAGNEGSNACYSSPASAEKAITVGATSARGFFWTTLDALAGFSNVGTCVDIFAPGTRIPGPWAGDDVNGIVADGTSQAAPHVAGAAALYLQKHPNWTPAQVWEAMRADSLKGTIFYLGFGNSPNRLLNVAKI
jgi:subtilisin family serine protease